MLKNKFKLFVRCLFYFSLILFTVQNGYSRLLEDSQTSFFQLTSAKCKVDSLIYSDLKIPNLHQSILTITSQYNNDSIPSDEGVLQLLKMLELDDNEQTHILQLFKHESGNYKSKLTVNGKNLCGMRKPGRRVFLGESETLFGYAVYKHWHLSVIDFYIWYRQNRWNQKSNFRTYLKSRRWN